MHISSTFQDIHPVHTSLNQMQTSVNAGMHAHITVYYLPTQQIPYYLFHMCTHIYARIFFSCTFMNTLHVSRSKQSDWGMYSFSRMCSVLFPQPSQCVAAASEVLSLPPPIPLCIASQQTESEC